MQKKVLNFIRQQHMFDTGDRVLAAVSGGADSVCLLTLLCRLQKTLGLESIYAVHMHHGLRGQEADRDAAYVAELCRKLQVPCIVVYRDVSDYAKNNGCSVEEAGRILRYEVFSQILLNNGLNKIAVAHHRDDHAETILHHLVRGSGLKGLAGIVPVREGIVRPLLCVGRKEIEAFLRGRKIAWCEDSTNDTEDYTRNKIRRSWIPLALELNDRAVENICQAGRFIRQADDYFEEQAQALFEQYGTWGQAGGALFAEYPTGCLSGQAEIIQAYVIRVMLRQCLDTLKNITSQHIFQIRELLEKQTGSHVDLPGLAAAERDYNKLRIFSRKTAENDKKSLPDLHFRKFSSYNAEEIPKNQYTKWFDYDKIKGMLSVRTRKSGDYLTIGSGRKKQLKAYLIDEKIPQRIRAEIPLLAEENHIIWIIGYRISEYYKITNETKTILEVTVDGGETVKQSSCIPESTPR